MHHACLSAECYPVHGAMLASFQKKILGVKSSLGGVMADGLEQ